MYVGLMCVNASRCWCSSAYGWKLNLLTSLKTSGKLLPGTCMPTNSIEESDSFMFYIVLVRNKYVVDKYAKEFEDRDLDTAGMYVCMYVCRTFFLLLFYSRLM